MVGLNEGQFARLNVVNIGNPNELPPNPCGLVLRILGADGDVLIRDNKRVAPGKAVHLDLTHADLPGRDSGRVQIRAEVAIGNPDIRPACTEIIPTLEVIDRESRQTLVVLGLTPKLVAPPEPD